MYCKNGPDRLARGQEAKTDKTSQHEKKHKTQNTHTKVRTHAERELEDWNREISIYSKTWKQETKPKHRGMRRRGTRNNDNQPLIVSAKETFITVTKDTEEQHTRSPSYTASAQSGCGKKNQDPNVTYNFHVLIQIKLLVPGYCVHNRNTQVYSQKISYGINFRIGCCTSWPTTWSRSLHPLNARINQIISWIVISFTWKSSAWPRWPTPSGERG